MLAETALQKSELSVFDLAIALLRRTSKPCPKSPSPCAKNGGRSALYQSRATLRGVRAGHGGDASAGDRAADAVAQYPRISVTPTRSIS